MTTTLPMIVPTKRAGVRSRPFQPCFIGTARLGYQGHPHQFLLNTTVKSGIGLGAVMAPQWDMVRSSRSGMITWQEYTQRYQALMKQRYHGQPQTFYRVLGLWPLTNEEPEEFSDGVYQGVRQERILCCYCHDTHLKSKHCHRYLLVDFLKEIGESLGVDVIYTGEHFNYNDKD